MSCKIPFFAKNWFDLMDSKPDKFCKYQWALRKLVEKSFQNDDLIVYEDLARQYFSLVKYTPYKKLVEWEEYLLGMHYCVYWKDSGLPRWNESLLVSGRGTGKDGCISMESFMGISDFNPVKEYDVDICANNEEQATRPLKDIVQWLEEPKQKDKLDKFFKHTKEEVRGKKNKGRIRGHANNPSGKDGLRSGVVVLNEIHEYDDYSNVDVFMTGLGKKPDSRLSIYTTNGFIEGGYLDDLIERADEILFEGESDDGFFPMIFQCDTDDEMHDESMWEKANPMLPYNPSLMVEYRKEYKLWKRDPAKLKGFPTKRCNRRTSMEETCVAKWVDIEATNKELPEIPLGSECTIGIDFAKTNDWAGVDVHFKHGDERYDINHAWYCPNSDDYPRYSRKIPLDKWQQDGHITRVTGKEISPNEIVNYIVNISKKYTIKLICMDSFRYALLEQAFKNAGINTKMVKMVRPSDLMKVYPIINRCFLNGFFFWGDNPTLRWSANNTKVVPAKKSAVAKDGENEIGNYLFGKIEPHARKTDPFMAVVFAMVGESEINDIVGPGENIWGNFCSFSY